MKLGIGFSQNVPIVEMLQYGKHLGVSYVVVRWARPGIVVY